MRNDLLADIVTASGGTITDRNNRNLLLKDWLDAVKAPAINYVARLNGTDQYWQLSEAIPLIGNFRVEVEVVVFDTVGTSWVIDGETTNNRRFDVSIAYLDEYSVSLNQKDYMKTIVNGQQAVSASTGELFELNLVRDGGVLDRSLREVFNIGSRFDGLETLNGYIRHFKVYDENDVLTHQIPLTNKAQGATQLATVGNVNATMIGYNEDVWEQV